MSRITTRRKIEDILNKVRPFIQGHGGDVKLVKIEGKTATLNVLGKCADCTLANLTYNNIVRGLINESVPEIKEIVFNNLRAKNTPGKITN